MESLLTILVGFGGIGLVGAIAYFITSRSGSKSGIMGTIHKITQKIGQEKIEKIEANQNKIKTEITINENLIDETKVKITEIQNQAAAEIAEVLKKDNVSNIHSVIENEWGDI